MKIRIKGNTVRYRLTKTEVEIFCKTGFYEETTMFVDKTFTYAIEAQKGLKELNAEYKGDTIRLLFPDSERKTWAISDKVGYSNSIKIGDNDVLSLLLEKDFVCLDEVEEDQSDNYPNPANTNQ